MNYNVVNTSRFAKEIKRLVKKIPSLKQEFASLLASISDNPFLGTPLGQNCFKIRISIRSKGKGKSGGARIITHLYLEKETVYLLTIYDKSEKPDLLPGELDDMIDALDFS
jgi:mRNA-degrading endonuclease RelE of RelBE toxin-antitoxin system